MKPTMYRLDTSAWTIERIMYAIAGVIAVTFAILTIILDPRFVLGDVLVGTMLIVFAVTGYCPLAILVFRYMRNGSRGDSTD